MPSTEEKAIQDAFYSLNETVSLAEGEKKSTVEVLRAGIIRDRGLKITKEMLTDFVSNYDQNVYGVDLQVNFGHQREGEAGGWIKRLFVEGESLMAEIEWTPLGKEKLSNKLYKFVSAEFADRFPHHETGKVFKNVFTGLALTNVPALKGQSAIALSEKIELTNNLNEIMFKKVLEDLSEREFVTSEDKKMLRNLLSELSEEEAKEVEEDVKAVEEKPEEAPVVEEKPEGEAEEGKEEEPKEGEEKKKEEKETPEGEGEPTPEEGGEEPAPETEKKEELTEKATETRLTEQEAKIKELTEKLESKELSEVFEKQVMLSEENTTGLLVDAKDEFVSLMTGLSQEQREGVLKLLSEVKAVDLSVEGSTDVSNLPKDEVEAVIKLTEQILEENPEMDPGDAQKKAAQKINESK